MKNIRTSHVFFSIPRRARPRALGPFMRPLPSFSALLSYCQFGLFFVLSCHEFAEALLGEDLSSTRGEPCEELAHHRSSASPVLAESKITTPCRAHVDIGTHPRGEAHQDTSMRINLPFVEQCSQTAFHHFPSRKYRSAREIILMVLLNSDVFSQEIPALEAVSRSWKETDALVTLKHRFATFFLALPPSTRTNCMSKQLTTALILQSLARARIKIYGMKWRLQALRNEKNAFSVKCSKLLRPANTSAVLKIPSSNSTNTRCQETDKLMPKNLADSISAINPLTPVSSFVKDHEVAAESLLQISCFTPYQSLDVERKKSLLETMNTCQLHPSHRRRMKPATACELAFGYKAVGVSVCWFYNPWSARVLALRRCCEPLDARFSTSIQTIKFVCDIFGFMSSSMILSRFVAVALVNFGSLSSLLGPIIQNWSMTTFCTRIIVQNRRNTGLCESVVEKLIGRKCTEPKHLPLRDMIEKPEKSLLTCTKPNYDEEMQPSHHRLLDAQGYQDNHPHMRRMPPSRQS